MPFFCHKLHENVRILTPGDVPGPLDPPMYTHVSYKFKLYVQWQIEIYIKIELTDITISNLCLLKFIHKGQQCNFVFYEEPGFAFKPLDFRKESLLIKLSVINYRKLILCAVTGFGDLITFWSTT